MSQSATQDGESLPPALKWAAILSVLFHIGVYVALTVTLPSFRKPPPPLEQPIAVEFVEVAEKTMTNRPPVEAPKPKEKKEEIKPVEKKVEKPPTPPKVDLKEPPKAVPPEPPKPKQKVVEKPSEVPPPPSEKLKEPEPKKPEPKPEEKPEVKQEDQFASLLKNLQETEPQPETDVVNPKAEAPPEPSPLAAFSQKLTMSEMDALRYQLSRCWSIQAGARYAEDLVVEIRLLVNADRSVQSATIVDQGRYNADGFFRAAADSAMRAVRSPMCNPLELPADKYDMWKDIVVRFDPREML
jgi:hypothetical protein